MSRPFALARSVVAMSAAGHVLLYQTEHFSSAFFEESGRPWPWGLLVSESHPGNAYEMGLSL
jgi:hypothetical protein